jgi:hypothetical protein
MILPIYFTARLQIQLPQQIADQLNLGRVPEDASRYVRLNSDQSLRVLTPNDNPRENLGFVIGMLRHALNWTQIEEKLKSLGWQAKKEVCNQDPELGKIF